MNNDINGSCELPQTFYLIFIRLRFPQDCYDPLTLEISLVICVDLFIQWGVLSISEIMLLSNTLTLIILLVLLILPFRPWLDGARLMLLLVMHIGIASGFALWNAKFTCPTKKGVCRLLNMYILIANWIIPATLLVYALGLAVMLYKRRKLKAVLPDLESSRSRQPESRQSILPMMVPADIRFPSVSTTPHTSVISQQLRESVWGAGASSSPPQSIVEGKRGSSSGRSRLSKPLPGSMYY
ncbi:hypothetical protein F5890DRAFT_858702 [Lentinula detonsa]|uniref:Uncharacterized protein n=1 Tax=Lentinula detonsa TaxID=2804962 RepID=A0AA38Q4D0_9AGAR|nr:hypothetical protein F5890DRAFT_858702 [Lentinula detonsa]